MKKVWTLLIVLTNELKIFFCKMNMLNPQLPHSCIMKKFLVNEAKNINMHRYIKKCKKLDERQISHLPHHQPTLMITYIQGIHCSILFKVSYIPMCKKCSLRFRNNHVNHTSTYSVLFFRAGVIFLRKSACLSVTRLFTLCYKCIE